MGMVFGKWGNRVEKNPLVCSPLPLPPHHPYSRDPASSLPRAVKPGPGRWSDLRWWSAGGLRPPSPSPPDPGGQEPRGGEQAPQGRSPLLAVPRRGAQGREGGTGENPEVDRLSPWSKQHPSTRPQGCISPQVERVNASLPLTHPGTSRPTRSPLTFRDLTELSGITQRSWSYRDFCFLKISEINAKSKTPLNYISHIVGKQVWCKFLDNLPSFAMSTESADQPTPVPNNSANYLSRV